MNQVLKRIACVGMLLGVILTWGKETDTLELPQLIVSNSRAEERRAEAPISISVLSNKDLEKTKANSLYQVLNQVPGVYVSDLGSEQHFMSIRQPISTKGYFLYLEDGIPIRPTGVFNHNALLEINMAGLERVEVIRGPSSSLYGSEAVGGALNFITKTPTLTPMGKVALRINDIGYKRVDIYHSNTEGKTGYSLSGYYAQRKDGPRDHSDYEKLSFNGKLHRVLTENLTFTAALGYVDYRSDMTGSLDSASFFSKNVTSLQTFTEREVSALRGRVTLDASWSSEAFTKATIFYRGSAIGQIPSYRVVDDYRRDFRTGTFSGNPNLAHGETNLNDVKGVGTFIQHLQNLPDWNLQLIGGIHVERSANSLKANYIKIQQDSISRKYTGYTATDSVKTNYDANLLNAAPYGQVKWSLLNSVHVTASARYDYFSYDYYNFLPSDQASTIPNTNTTFQHFSPKLGANVEGNFSSFYMGGYANVSQGFVPPQVSELYRSNGNPNLKPAVFDNYEVGTWISTRSLFTLEGSVYYIQGKDEITSVALEDGERQNQNAGKTSHVGVEWGTKVSPVSWGALRFNGSYAKHAYESFTVIQGGDNVSYNGKEIERAPNLLLNSSIEITPHFLPGFSANLEWQSVGNYWMDAANTKKYEGHDLFNLRTAWNIGQMQVWVHALNLLDTRYATSANSYPWGDRYNLGEERSINMGLSYSFHGTSGVGL